MQGDQRNRKGTFKQGYSFEIRCAKEYHLDLGEK